jgi:intein-encoded DNA endonuclease-like protein
MSQMTPLEATETLQKVLALQRQGLSWRHIAVALRLNSPQEAKKLAKEAARVSQNLLLRQGLAQR